MEELPLGEQVVFLGTQEALAVHLGVERKSIQRWMKKPDCPGRAKEGFNVQEWRAFIERNKLGKKVASKGKIELDNEKAALVNEGLRLRNAKARGEVCSIEEVVKVLNELVAGFTLNLTQAEFTIAEEVSGVDVGEGVKRLKRRHKEVLETLALGEWAQKKTFWSSVYAALYGHHKTPDLGLGQRSMSSTPFAT